MGRLPQREEPARERKAPGLHLLPPAHLPFGPTHDRDSHVGAVQRAPPALLQRDPPFPTLHLCAYWALSPIPHPPKPSGALPGPPPDHTSVLPEGSSNSTHLTDEETEVCSPMEPCSSPPTLPCDFPTAPRAPGEQPACVPHLPGEVPECGQGQRSGAAGGTKVPSLCLQDSRLRRVSRPRPRARHDEDVASARRAPASWPWL